jgi:predicted GIY-YIG superfamily endonuclease
VIEATDSASVYELFDHAGQCLYVGATRNVGNRFSWHSKSQPWWGDVDPTRTVVTFYADRWSAREAERDMIRERQPRHNRGGVTTGHIPYPARRPEGFVPEWTEHVLEVMRRREVARIELRDSVVTAAQHGASVRELAAFTGLSTNTISRWKRGE